MHRHPIVAKVKLVNAVRLRGTRCALAGRRRGRPGGAAGIARRDLVAVRARGGGRRRCLPGYEGGDGLGADGRRRGLAAVVVLVLLAAADARRPDTRALEAVDAEAAKGARTHGAPAAAVGPGASTLVAVRAHALPVAAPRP